jgi:DNA repair ATPase RecN
MKKDRLEWVISGLNRYTLTKGEDQFVKSAERDFTEKSNLTQQQEERLEALYKEKSKLMPNKSLSPTRRKILRWNPLQEVSYKNHSLRTPCA